MTNRLNHEDAHAAFVKVCQHYADIITHDNQPELTRDWEKTWDSPEPIVPWAIVWHEGPDDWAIAVNHGDIIPAELAFAEPATGQVLSLYPV